MYTLVRKRIFVTGIVQGVGFRPAMFRAMTTVGLSGRVANTSQGMCIEVQGPKAIIDDFAAELSSHAPPLARVFSIRVEDAPVEPAASGVVIESSRATETRDALVLSDVATCDDCLRELFDSSDRRYRYPFINCTACGPRYTIVKDIPYDRSYTAMADFPMCPACRAEYEDPTHRRFHAQPIACWDCGPTLEAWDAQGRTIEVSDPIVYAQECLRNGQIVAIKGLGGFHLAVDATNEMAVRTLRKRKHREGKALAVMVKNVEAARRIVHLSSENLSVLTSVERPIVLARTKPDHEVASSVAPDLVHLGIFLPYTPIHHRLFEDDRIWALVMTSANQSDAPICVDNAEALARLAGLADAYLVHDRDILYRTDDSVVRPTSHGVQVFRRARGYVPVPFDLGMDAAPLLAVGGALKNTVCLTRGRQAFVSPHIGDLENVETERFFTETIAHLQHMLGVTPKVLAHDLHPDYRSTRWAIEQSGLQKVAVQHHHAHVAAVMGMNGLSGSVVGLALDGTGYGSDGTVWGGEVLVADRCGFQRAGHLSAVPLPGGSAAITAPWRMAVAYLYMHYKEETLAVLKALKAPWDLRKVSVLMQMIRAGVQCPLTSSAGRLFDAVASLLGGPDEVQYEGEAAMVLEAWSDDTDDDGSYPFAIVSGPPIRIDPRPMLDALIRNQTEGVPKETIARRFHHGLADAFVEVATRVARATKFHRVCLGGGCFQNECLTNRIVSGLRAQNLSVFLPNALPVNDGGLSFGQAVVAAARANS